jgi:Tfp pilus assembly PilM family ATPase
MKLRRIRYSPIGIDIGSDAIKALQLKCGRAGPSLFAATVVPRSSTGSPIGPADFDRIARVLSRQGFVGDDVVLGVPADRLITAALELPPRTSNAPLDDIARTELARAGRTEPNAIESSWWPLPGTGRPGEGTHGIGVACKHTDACALLDAGESAGLNILALDVLPVAAVRSVVPLCAGSGGLTGVLDIGHSACELLLLHERTLVYQRSMKELGTGRILTALAQAGHEALEPATLMMRSVGCLPGADGDTSALGASIRSLVGQMIDGAADELRMSVSYAQRRFGGELTRVLLIGGGAELPGVLDRATRKLGVDVRMARASELVGPGPTPLYAGPALVHALGLALHIEAGGTP